MSCNSMIILKAGSLEKEVITLQTKDQEEAIYYQFSLEERIGEQIINSVSWTANFDDIDINNITIDQQTFKCLISGGTIYTNVGISFKVITNDGEIRTFNCVLPIRPEGVMETSDNNTVIILNGKTPSGSGINNLTIGTVTTLSPDQKATAEIVHGTGGEDKLNLGLVKGEKGDTGAQGIQGERGDTGSSLNYLQGKKISVYGDSISTFTGYIPDDGRPKASYPASNVTSVDNTWWMQVINKTGATLGVNDSWSGSCITGNPDTDKACLGYRVKSKSIPSDTDLCFILSGINDLRSQKTLGTFDGLKKQADLDSTMFADCVSNVMYLSAQNYPNTTFVWITPLGDFTWPQGFPKYVTNQASKTYQDYNSIIKEAAAFYGYKCINMHDYFSFLRASDFIDGLHPKLSGMTRIANAVLNNITNNLG